MLTGVPLLQVSQELLQQGIQRLYEGYRVYAVNTPSAWMQAVDAAAVRQVLVLAGSIWHTQCRRWLGLDFTPESTIVLLSVKHTKTDKSVLPSIHMTVTARMHTLICIFYI